MSEYTTKIVNGEEVELTPEEISELEIRDLEYQAELPNLLLNQIKIERDRLLAETDFTMMMDIPITEESRNDFIEYRQSLRDLPENVDVFNPVWPTKPEYVKE
jgi:hypothetical protein